MSEDFVLHERLAADCSWLGDFPLCRLLLLEDANYPWFILVPRRPGLCELHELEVADQARFMVESSLLARAMEKAFSPDKLNIASLGNLVPQLHVHHIARYRDDPAWPRPVWGHAPARPYTREERLARRERLLPIEGLNDRI